jgi:divalent metal cation (Fe/Co/Zn/Cd) transporter
MLLLVSATIAKSPFNTLRNSFNSFSWVSASPEIKGYINSANLS